MVGKWMQQDPAILHRKLQAILSNYDPHEGDCAQSPRVARTHAATTTTETILVIGSAGRLITHSTNLFRSAERRLQLIT